MRKGQGRGRQQEGDPTVCLFCGLVDSCMRRLLTTVALIRPPPGLSGYSVLVSFVSLLVALLEPQIALERGSQKIGDE